MSEQKWDDDFPWTPLFCFATLIVVGMLLGGVVITIKQYNDAYFNAWAVCVQSNGTPVQTQGGLMCFKEKLAPSN